MTTYQEVACIIPAPFILNQIFGGGGNADPLELILVVKAAATDLNNLHSMMEEFVNVDAKIQAKRFAMWAFAAYKSYIDKTTFKTEPDSEELQQFCDKRHSKCIITSINQARTTQSNLSNHGIILEQLGRGLNQMGEANEAANNQAKRQIELKELQVELKRIG